MIAVARTCGEVWHVHRGSFEFRLCGLAGDLISSVPIAAPATAPLYSWRRPDGTKPGFTQLDYTSRASPDDLRRALTTFLARAGFRANRKEDGLEWWSTVQGEIGFAVGPPRDGSSPVQVIHSTGLE